MQVYFEELSGPKRAGGIESACCELVDRLRAAEVSVVRSSATAWKAKSLPDCVHIQGLWSPLLAKRFWRWKLRGVPCVVSPHGMLSEWALAHKPLRKKIAWWLYQKNILKSADAVHATSETEALQFKEQKIQSNIAIIPWGVTATLADVGRSDTRTQEFRTAVFAGRLCPIKGLPMLFEAWQRVRPPRWKLRVIGPDEAGFRATLESIVRSQGISDSVTFEGAFTKAALRDACANADLFVLPSYSENFGMVVGEALALGVPVLTTQGTPWKRVAETNCGWWVPPTTDGIASALQAATSLPSADLRRMGHIGAELVAREFSWDITIQKFYDLYITLSARSGQDVADRANR